MTGECRPPRGSPCRKEPGPGDSHPRSRGCTALQTATQVSTVSAPSGGGFGKLIFGDAKLLSGPGFGDGGQGVYLEGGQLLIPVAFISFLVSLILFCCSSGFLFAASEKTLGRSWPGVFAASARLAPGCCDG